MKYEYLNDLTSDIVFKAYGKDIKELFVNSAEALFSIICKIDKVKAKKQITIGLDAGDYKSLLFSWLQSLIAAVDTEEMFFSRFKIKKISDKGILAECWGEDISPEKGTTLVKAVTNYKFELEEKEGTFFAVVSLDI
jgi:SHS2 domain-containing protein